MNIRCIDTLLQSDLAGKTVLVRAGLNVPLDGEVITNTYRLDVIKDTLKFLQDSGAKTILIGHIGRELDETLEPLLSDFESRYQNFFFKKDFFKNFSEASFEVNERSLIEHISHVEDGSITLLDNIRQTSLEKENNERLNHYLYSIADFYVNEAFPVAHRKHSSTYGAPLLFEKDEKFLGKRFHMEQSTLLSAQKPENPSLFVLGGAKFDTKFPMILKFESIYDHVLIGGTLLNTILFHMKHEIGESIYDELNDDQMVHMKQIISSEKLIIPEYVVCETVSGEKVVRDVYSVKKEDKIMDIAPESIDSLKELIHSKKSVLWNGPLGYYEGGYTEGSDRLAEYIGSSDSYSIAGGGDTITAIENTGNADSFDFLSSGGGSTIDLLKDGTLAAITALEQ